MKLFYHLSSFSSNSVRVMFLSTRTVSLFCELLCKYQATSRHGWVRCTVSGVSSHDNYCIRIPF